MPLSDREDCKNKNKVFAELQSGYDKMGHRKWNVQGFLFQRPDDNWLQRVRPPYNVRWYGADSPEVKRGDKQVSSVYLEATDVASGARQELYIGKI
jgi:hypothetical protein